MATRSDPPRPYPPRLALFPLLAFIACGHPGNPPAPPTPMPSPPPGEVSPFKPLPPLPDGRYVFRRDDLAYTTDILEVREGLPSLIPDADDRQASIPLAFVGSGPMWGLVNREPERFDFHAEFLSTGDGVVWAYRTKSGQGQRLARMRDVAERLRGRWRVVPNTWVGKGVAWKIQGIELGPRLLRILAPRDQGGAPKTIASLGKDANGPVLGFPPEPDFTMRMAEHAGKLVVSFGNKATVLFSRDPSSPSEKRSGTNLRGQSVLFLAPTDQDITWTGVVLRCQDQGCDAEPLGQPERGVRLSPAAMEEGGPSLRLTLPGALWGVPHPLGIELARLGDKLVSLGLSWGSHTSPISPVALAVRPPAEAPPDLSGTWKATTVFPMANSLTGLHLGSDGVTTTHRDGKTYAAYLVRSAFDDGVLLLAREPYGDASKRGGLAFSLSRLSRGPGGWYVSRWSDGVGLFLLHQGSVPSWSPRVGLQNEIAEFCDLEKHLARIAAFPDDYARDARVALTAYNKSRDAASRFRHVTERDLFDMLPRISSEDMPRLLDRQRGLYGLPPVACPALAHIIDHLHE